MPSSPPVSRFFVMQILRAFVLTMAVIALAGCGGSNDDGAAPAPTAESAAGDQNTTGDTSSMGDGDDATGEVAGADDDGGISLNSGAVNATDPDAVLPAPGDEATTVGADGVVMGSGVDDNTINVGYIVADTDDPQAMTGVMAGHNAYWNQVNGDGGIAGRSVEMRVAVSNGSASGHLQAADDFVAEDTGVLMLGGVAGHQGTVALLATLSEHALVAVPFTQWSGWGDPERGANILEVQASDCAQAMNSMSWAAERLGDTVALVSAPGQPWADAAAGARLSIDSDDIQLDLDATGRLTSGDLTGLIDELVATDPETVWLATDADTAAAFIRAAIDAGYVGEFSGVNQAYDPAGDPDLYDRFHLTAPHEMWGAPVPGMDALREGLISQNAFEPISADHVMGWLQARAAHAAISRVADEGTLTRTALLAAADSLRVANDALAPNQEWGDPATTAPRASYLYEAVAGFDPGATVSDDDAATGYLLRKGPFTSAAALAWDGSTCSTID